MFPLTFGLYFLVRIFSFFFPPDTPLHAAHIFNTLLCSGIVLSTTYLLIRRHPLAWQIIAGEILLGGTGGYLAMFGLSLRTMLLVVSGVIFSTQILLDFKKNNGQLFFSRHNQPTLFSIALVIVAGLYGAARGFFLRHSFHLIFSDLIPYFFLWYYISLTIEWSQPRFRSTITACLITTVVGNALFLGFTYVGFATHFFILQDAYYHWFRDVAGGKITPIEFDFYRLVLNEHLLLIPILLITCGQAIQNGIKRHHKTIILASLFILALNLTRSYFLALGVGIMLLYSRQHLRRWLFFVFGIPVVFMIIFTSLFVIGSRGHSIGWEVFGVRLWSIASPTIEDSSLSRLLLLPHILSTIANRPLLGSGLGATVTVYSPILKQIITTPQFDWGFLEMMAELGIIGIIPWLWILWRTWAASFFQQKKITFYGASLVAILIINITSPALFHALGILWITVLLSLTSQESA